MILLDSVLCVVAQMVDENRLVKVIHFQNALAYRPSLLPWAVVER